ncbi:hypothetical protein D9619_004838 [Psilocybe cf. subviscida]|uniref:Uncharacterized protein n=1 Tax=Psilocybe cf. subviscida TaxID=2480587 RepID=A0A8H5F8C3_9AGAR|nr:hypothetical protein D9619_004838 [Psilocybe cf. subviscida]
MQHESGQTNSHFSNLPQELVDRILDELAQPFREGLHGHSERWGKLQEWEARTPNYSSSRYLKESSLVCRRFRPRCQFHLFAGLRIAMSQHGVAGTHDFTITREGQRARVCSQIIQAGKTVLPATSLSIVLNFDNFEEFNHTDYADHIHLFQSIRQSSIRWESLCLSGTGQGSLRAHRSITLETMLLRPFIRTADITEITLLNIKLVPFTLLSSCPGLNRLVCVDSTIEPPSQSKTPTTLEHVAHLIELSIYNTFNGFLFACYGTNPSPLTWIQTLTTGADSKCAPIIDISKLRTLQLRTAALKHSRIRRSAREAELNVHKLLAMQCGSHLSNLCVDIGDVSSGPVLFLPLHYFTNLAHLDVIANFSEANYISLMTALPCFCQWLACLPQSRVLATINLHLEVTLFHVSISTFLDAGWDALETTLMDLLKHSQCIKPHISFFFALSGVTPGVIKEIPGQYLQPRHEGDEHGIHSWQWVEMVQKIGRYVFQVALPGRFLHLPRSERFCLSIYHGTKSNG